MGMFSRRHYEIIADVLRKHRPHGADKGEWIRIVSDFFDVLELDNNEGFDRSKFLKRCNREQV